METYIDRELQKEVTPFLKRKEILALIGPRQAGKTTLLQHIFAELIKQKKKTAFLTFERERDLALFENIEDFKEYYQDYDVLIIDEFHYAKEGGKKLKYLFDTTEIKFIISGSSSLEITFSAGKFLVGRMVKFSLHPFSFREFLLAKDKELHRLLQSRLPSVFDRFAPKNLFGNEVNSRLRKHFEDYLVFGGYPAVLLAKTEQEKIKILESILDNYLLKDIKGLLHLKTQRELVRLGEFLATQIGGLLNYKELSVSTGLPHKSVLEHLSIMENTFIVRLLKPFYRNPRTELVKTPKVYFFDNGFRNYLLSDFREFSKRTDQGELVENFVWASLQRQGFSKVNFWRTKSKAEVDFIVQNKGEIIPIEVKYSDSPSLGKSFYSFLEKFSPEKGYIFTKQTTALKKVKNIKIYFVPVYYL